MQVDPSCSWDAAQHQVPMPAVRTRTVITASNQLDLARPRTRQKGGPHARRFSRIAVSALDTETKQPSWKRAVIHHRLERPPTDGAPSRPPTDGAPSNLGAGIVAIAQASPNAFNEPGLNEPDFTLELRPPHFHEYWIVTKDGQSAPLEQLLVADETLSIPEDSQIDGPLIINCTRQKSPASGPIDYECVYVHEHRVGEGEHRHEFRLSQFILTSDGWGPPHSPDQTT
jgi:hypothetical protein